MMQRRKHMMSREKFISVLFRQQQSGLSIADFVRMKVIAVVDSILETKIRYNGAGVIGRSLPLRG